MNELVRKHIKNEKALAVITYAPLAIQAFNTLQRHYIRHQQKKREGDYTLNIAYDSWFAKNAFLWALSKTSYEAKKVVAITDSFFNWKTMDDVLTLDFHSDVNIEFTFVLDGHAIRTSLSEDEVPEAAYGRIRNMDANKRVNFRTTTLAGMNALKAALQELFDEKSSERAERGEDNFNFNIWTSSGWSRGTRVERPLSSVILKEGEVDAISGDLEKFLLSRDSYINKGIPWRRGYLLYGPPGTGKSSIVKGLAAEFGMSLYYVSLSEVTSDNAFTDAVSRIEGRSILLIEDVDVFSAAQDRDGDKAKISDRGLTLSGLLNVLDGPASPDNLVTFMTTNHLERLDPALIRKGRVDYSLEVGMPNLYQIKEMWKLFYGTECEIESINPNIPTVDYYDIFKRNLDTPELAHLELLDKAQTKV